MHFFCIGDEDTVRGFRLGGVPGEAVAERSRALEAFGQAVKRPDCGVVLLTEHIATMLRVEIDAFRMARSLPLVAILPHPAGARTGFGDFDAIVRQAIGIPENQESDR